MGWVSLKIREIFYFREQKFLREKIKEYDDFSWKLENKDLKYVKKYSNLLIPEIAGVDISFAKDIENVACSYFIVLSYPDFKV